jgi:hypothetical protein
MHPKICSIIIPSLGQYIPQELKMEITDSLDNQQFESKEDV